MPDTNAPPKLAPLELRKADELGHYIRTHCQLCRVTYHFRPIDLAELVGDVMCSALVGRMRCTQCGRADYVTVRLVWRVGDERARMRVRRLAGIKTIRTAVWRDE